MVRRKKVVGRTEIVQAVFAEVNGKQMRAAAEKLKISYFSVSSIKNWFLKGVYQVEKKSK